MPDKSSPFSAGTLRVAVLQVVPVFLDAWATWEKIKAMALKAVSYPPKFGH
ncbi:MAG: carbon-nitrogen hydrolase family protein [Pelagimonas sp.]|jgi:predicted amidohydrolase|nr:carbon-nitrogen hydrolase family protein [Pelagimonas sp.]